MIYINVHVFAHWQRATLVFFFQGNFLLVCLVAQHWERNGNKKKFRLQLCAGWMFMRGEGSPPPLVSSFLLLPLFFLSSCCIPCIPLSFLGGRSLLADSGQTLLQRSSIPLIPAPPPLFLFLLLTLSLLLFILGHFIAF